MTLPALAAVHVPLVLAHLGHWYFQLLFAAPVMILVAVLSYQGWRDNRAREKGDARRPRTPRR